MHRIVIDISGIEYELAQDGTWALAPSINHPAAEPGVRFTDKASAEAALKKALPGINPRIRGGVRIDEAGTTARM